MSLQKKILINIMEYAFDLSESGEKTDVKPRIIIQKLLEMLVDCRSRRK